MKPLFLLAATLLLLASAGCSLLADPFPLPTHVPTIALPTDEVIASQAQAPIETTEAAAPTLTSTPRPVRALPVWVANPVDQVILKIDPATNSIVKSIPVEGNPDRIAVGELEVWALDRQNNRLFRIDPQTDQVTATVELPPGRPETLTTGAGAVWVGMTGQIDLVKQEPGLEEELVAPSWVLAIDPKSGEVRDKFAVQPVNRLATSGPNLWILSRGVIETPLQLIDPIHREGWTVPLRNAPEWLPADALAVDGENLWLLSTAYGKIFHATADGEIQAAVNLEARKPTGYPDLLLSNGGLWAATPWGTVLHIDPVTNRVKGRIDLDVPLTQLVSGHDSVWVVSLQTGQIFRIDPEHNEVVAVIPTGSQVEPTVVPSPTPRIVLWKPCPDSPTSRLKVGDIAYVSKDPPMSNRVRQEPNREAEVLGYINPGGGMNIIEGPACSDGWVWWKVRNADLEGWTAEGDHESYWLIPLYE